MGKTNYLVDEGYKILFTMAYGCKIVRDHADMHFPSPPKGWNWKDDSGRKKNVGSTYYREWFRIIRRR